MSVLDPRGVSAAAKALYMWEHGDLTDYADPDYRECVKVAVAAYLAVAGSPADGNPHRRDAERLRALNPPLPKAAADADKRADEWDATFAAGLAAGRAAASPADERLREAPRETVARALWEFDGYMEPWHESERALYFEKADAVLAALAEVSRAAPEPLPSPDDVFGILRGYQTEDEVSADAAPDDEHPIEQLRAGSGYPAEAAPDEGGRS